MPEILFNLGYEIVNNQTLKVKVLDRLFNYKELEFPNKIFPIYILIQCASSSSSSGSNIKAIIEDNVNKLQQVLKYYFPMYIFQFENLGIRLNGLNKSPFDCLFNNQHYSSNGILHRLVIHHAVYTSGNTTGGSNSSKKKTILIAGDTINWSQRLDVVHFLIQNAYYKSNIYAIHYNSNDLITMMKFEFLYWQLQNDYNNQNELCKVDEKIALNPKFFVHKINPIPFHDWYIWFNNSYGLHLTPNLKKKFNYKLLNPLLYLPIVVVDIETIANNNNVIPKGVTRDQAISSITLSVYLRNSQERGLYYTFVYTYLPRKLEKMHNLFKKNYNMWQESLNNSIVGENYIKQSGLYVFMFPTELDMLINFITHYGSGELLKNLTSCDCHYFTGYNIHNYDIPTIVRRLMFYQQTNLLKNYITYHSKTKQFLLNPKGFCIDFMKVVMQNFSFGLRNFKLATVTKHFLNSQSKYDLNSVDIRRVYRMLEKNFELTDEWIEEEFFTLTPKEIKYNNYCLPSFTSIILYAIVDCLSIIELWLKCSVDQMIASFTEQWDIPIDNIFSNGDDKTHRFGQLVDKKALVAGRFLTPRPPLIYYYKLADNTISHIDTEKILIEMSTKKTTFMGAINYAKPGFYACGGSMDFASFYPNTNIEYNISYENIIVVTGQILKNIISQITTLDANNSCICKFILTKNNIINYKYLEMFYYDTPQEAANFDNVFATLKNYCKSIADLQEINPNVPINFQIHSPSFKLAIPAENLKTLNDILELDDKARVLISFKIVSGLLPHMFKQLLDGREIWKEKMKSCPKYSLDYIIADQRQLSMKISANSGYGALSCKQCELKYFTVSAAITLLCRRNILLVCGFLLNENLAKQIIYIDTDGIKYLPNVDPTKENLNDYHKNVVCRVNEWLRKIQNLSNIKLAPENIYDYIFILSKKKYIEFYNIFSNSKSMPYIKMCGIEKHDLISIRIVLLFFFHKCVLYYHGHKGTNNFNIDAIFFSIYKYLSTQDMAKNVKLNRQKNKTTDRAKYIYKVVQQYGASFGQYFQTLYLCKFQKGEEYENGKLLLKNFKKQIYMPAIEKIPPNYCINLFYMLNNYYKILQKIVNAIGIESSCQVDEIAASVFYQFIQKQQSNDEEDNTIESIDEKFYKRMA
jgi:DNA polymerase elongation subunit (family B)